MRVLLVTICALWLTTSACRIEVLLDGPTPPDAGEVIDAPFVDAGLPIDGQFIDAGPFEDAAAVAETD